MRVKEKRKKENQSVENPEGLTFKDYISEKMHGAKGRDGKAHASAADIAEALELSTKVLQEILNGRRNRPDRRDLVIAICAELGLDAGETNEALGLYPGFLHKLAADDARDRAIAEFLNAGFDSEISFKALNRSLTEQGFPGLKTRHRNSPQYLWKRRNTVPNSSVRNDSQTSRNPHHPISAAAFKKGIINAYAALRANEQKINDLNVFPVPDGDTGTNMSLTMQGAVAELEQNDYDTITGVSDSVASSLLRAARGNSGVILSLLFRGISGKLRGLQEADPKSITAAMQEGVKAAYKAVAKPAEGTILTVSRLASAAAAKAASRGADLESSLEAAVAAGESALANTKNLNPVLKKAGVVDAGGMGYMIILRAILDTLRGKSVAVAEPLETAGDSEYDPMENITFTYDTVYIVRKNNPAVDLEPLRAFLEGIGDSLIINEDEKIFKVHDHTDDPGLALTESLKYGPLEIAKIENMVLQAEEIKKKKSQSIEPEKKYGIVAVVAGDGMQKLFQDVGADRIVSGGQTMNPSTDDILREIRLTPAETVFVFPNNKNIIMAAEAAAELCTEKQVVVIPTTSMPQGISALLNFDASEKEKTLIKTMKKAAAGVHTVMVTHAARDSDFGGYEIREGEYLALLDGALLGSFVSEEIMFGVLCSSFTQFKPSFITVYFGENMDAQSKEKAESIISGRFPEVDVTVVDGGQPVYQYMISVE